MLSFSDAIDIIYKQKNMVIKKIDVEYNYNSVLDMVIAEDIVCPENTPSFMNSAMDGFAINTANISPLPCKVSVNGTISAGDSPDKFCSGVLEIMTGAPVPKEFDSIIKVEDVEILSKNENDRPDEILIKHPFKSMQNIRSPGTDYAEGDSIINTGEIINARHIMAFSAMGIKSFKVYTKPSISIISTGNELVSFSQEKLTAGKIRNSNSCYLQAICSVENINVIETKLIKDNKKKFKEYLTSIINSKANIVVSTGAVSIGRFDFIHECVKNLGAKILFHKVSIRPGKPVLLAVFPNGTYYFGLPGNPISTAVCFRFFVNALIRSLQGLKPETTFKAKALISEIKPLGLKYFRKAYYTLNEEGHILIKVLNDQESHKIHPMTKANCWAIYDENTSMIKANDFIEFMPFDTVLGNT